MHETNENREEFHRSLSSSNLQAGGLNQNPTHNLNPNPSWIVEMERHLENNLMVNLTQNLKSIIDESVNKAIEKVMVSVNKMIEANPVIQSHGTAISELKINSTNTQTSINKINKEQEGLIAKMLSIGNRSLENCLVFRGLPENDYKKENEARQKVKSALRNLISSNSEEEAMKTVNNIEIHRCRHLGKYNKERARPISVYFLRKDDTDCIMENKTQLPHGIYMDREYNQDTEQKHKLLRPILKAARQHKDYQGRCKMEWDTLVIRGKRFTLNTIDQLPSNLSTLSVTSKSDETTFGYFGKLNPLSNFHPSPFKIHDKEYHCSKQYIQEAKAKYFDDNETWSKLHSSKTGLECK